MSNTVFLVGALLANTLLIVGLLLLPSIGTGGVENIYTLVWVAFGIIVNFSYLRKVRIKREVIRKKKRERSY